MKDPRAAATLPSADKSDAGSRFNRRETRSRPKPGSSFFSCESLKSNSSKWDPPYFSPDLPEIDDATISSQDKRDTLRLSELKSVNLLKDDLHVKPSHYRVLELYQRQLKSLLKLKNECLIEGLRAQQGPVPLKKIYTEVFQREGRGEVNQEHDLRQIEQAFNKQKTPESPSIHSKDIFRPFSDRDRSVRTVLTTGVAGIGKTVLVQKFILDWCEGRAHQDVQLLFPLPFRQLNLLQNQRKTLMELLQDFSPGLKESRIRDLSQYKVLFILDGLDECRLHLDFSTNYKSTDAATAMPVDALLTNLIQGNLLPTAQLWITTRLAAAGTVPPTLIHRVTEIRGFNNLQKEAYFLKNIQDQTLSRRVISSIRSCPPLYSMCHHPGFCWITAYVFVKMSSRMTLTHLHVHFLTYQMKKMQQKYGQDQTRVHKMILSLSKLAFKQLQKGKSIFYAEDLKECGLDVKEAVVYSGVCTQVFREDNCSAHKIFSFVHLSVQDFLAALYVHVTFCEDGVNLMEKKQRPLNLSLSHLHRTAVDRALRDHHLDLFLRFLLGLSLESSHFLLSQLHIQERGCEAEGHRGTVDYLQEKTRLSLHPHRYKNLVQCLNELKERSLLQEIKIQQDSDLDSDLDSE